MRDFSAQVLALLLEEIRPALVGRTLREAGAQRDFPQDLLLFFPPPEGAQGGRVHCLRIVLRREAARVHLEPRPRAAKEAHPRIRTLSARLAGRPLEEIRAFPGERRFLLGFGKGLDPPGRLDLMVELFPPGNWLLLGADGRILLCSAERKGARPLRPGEIYRPPPPPPPGEEAPLPEWLPAEPGRRNQAAARYFDALDEAELSRERRKELAALLKKASAKAAGRVRALEAQLQEIARAPELRRRAELLKAKLHEIPRGAASVEVQDWFDPDLPLIRIPLDPPRPPREVVESLFKKARRLEKGRPLVEARLEEARELARLAGRALEILETLEGDPLESEELAPLLERLEEEKLLPKAKTREASRPPREEMKIRKASGGERFRRFTSREGWPILVGRDGRQNDLLTLRVARGNDLWFHVAGGTAGSHVVVRVPKGKQPGEETLLDAAHLAVYYSKSRGRPFVEVLWTQRKWVRKPKGFPPGKVLVDRFKTLKIRTDEERLRRILATAAGEEGS